MAKNTIKAQYLKQIKRIENLLSSLQLDIKVKDISKPTRKTVENLKKINKRTIKSYVQGNTQGKSHFKRYLSGIPTPTSTSRSTTSTRKRKSVSSTKPKRIDRQVSSTKPDIIDVPVSSTKPEVEQPSFSEQTQQIVTEKRDVVVVDDMLIDKDSGEVIERIDLSMYYKEDRSISENTKELFDRLREEHPDYNILTLSEYSKTDAIDSEYVIEDRLNAAINQDTEGSKILQRILTSMTEEYGKDALIKAIQINQKEIFEAIDAALRYDDDIADHIDKAKFLMNVDAIKHYIWSGIHVITGQDDSPYRIDGGFTPTEESPF